MLNVAEIVFNTRALGPGSRAVIWMQGCPFHCPGCYSPQWIPDVPAHLYPPEDLAELILSNREISGITISGGEPFYQSEGLGIFLSYIKANSELNVICFTGYRFKTLINSKDISIKRMLKYIDVLIDGPFVKENETVLGLRGSTNQKIYHLSNSLIHTDFISQKRVNEIKISNNEFFAVGIPTREIKNLLSASFLV